MKLLLAFSLLAVVFPLHGALTWIDPEVQVESEPGAKEAKAIFHFKNDGKEDVRIARIRTSCGCTVAEIEKKDFRPGEEGKLEMTFRFEGRTGRQRKSTIVRTDDGAVQELEMIVDISSGARFDRDSFEWKIGSRPEKQTAVLKVADDGKTQLVSVRATSDRLEVEFEPIDQSSYRVIAAPSSTDAPLTGLIFAEIEGGNVQNVVLPFAVKK